MAAFDSTPLLDDFNRPDQTHPMTGWTPWISSGLQVISTQCAPMDGGDNGSWFNTALTGPDVEAYITIATHPVNGGQTVVGARLDPATGGAGTFYQVEHNPNAGTDTINIARTIAGSWTMLQSFNQDLAAGDKLGIRCIGSTIEAWFWHAGAWTLVGSAADTNLSGTFNQTHIGLYNYGNGGTGARYDDLHGGIYVAAPVTVGYGSGAYGDGPYGGGGRASGRIATYSVEVAWSSSIPGVAVLDVSVLGGTDTLGVGGAAYVLEQFGGPYDDITNRSDNHVRCESITFTRGRSDDMTDMQALSATITGRDPTGMMNVHNPNSPLNQNIPSVGAIRPLRPVRVIGHYGGADYPQLFGFLRSIDYEPQGRTGTFKLEVTDLFAMLDTPRKDQPQMGVQPVIAYTTTAPAGYGGGTLTTGIAIGMVLDYIGWTDPTFRNLDAGDTLPFFEATGNNSALDLIAQLVNANLGFFYIDPAGVATFKDRNSRFLRPVAYGFTNEMRAIGSGVTLDSIRNRWDVTRQVRSGPGSYGGGTVQTANDFASAHDYGERADQLSSPWILSDAVASALANQLVSVTKDPTNPIWQLSVENRSAYLMEAMLTLDVIDRVAVQEAETDTQGVFFIEQMSVTITAQGHKHAVQYLLSDRSAVAAANLDPFVLGTDVLDGVKTLSF